MDKRGKTYELVIANEEKAKRIADKLVIANGEKQNRADELVITIKELVLAKEKEKLVAELIIANKELTFQITERKQAEQALKESNDKFLRLTDNISGYIAYVNANTLQYEFVNGIYEKSFGIPREKIIGSHIKDILGETNYQFALKYINKVKSGESISYENTFDFASGKRWLQVNYSPVIDANGHVESIAMLSYDITELRQAELEESIRSRIADIFLTVPDTEMFNEVLKVILEIMKSPFGVFGYIDEYGANIVPTITRQIWDECKISEKTFRFPRETWGDGTWACALREKRTIYSNEPSTNIPEGHAKIQRHISKPILFQGEPIGLLQVANKETDYTERDLRILGQISDHVAPILNSILKRQKAEVAMLESEEKYSKAFLSSPYAITITSIEDGKFIDFNHAFISISGFTREEVTTNSAVGLDMWLNIEDRKWVESTLLDGGDVEGKEFLFKKKNGEIINTLFYAKIIKIKNKPHIISIINDITERKQNELELINAKEKAEESDKLKSAFLYNMSHEIRTPMNGILGFAELLKEPNLTGEEQQDFIQTIQKSGARMLNTINSIVDISKIESKMMEIDIKESNINKQIEFVYKFFKPEVESKGLLFFFKNSLPSKEAIIKTDPEKMYAILTNLVKNAIKFTNEGSIEFGYEKRGNTLNSL